MSMPVHPEPDRSNDVASRAPVMLPLVLGGAMAGAAVVAWVKLNGLALTVGHAGVIAFAVLVVVTGALARRAPKLALYSCFAAGIFGYLAWTWGYDVVSFPYVDMIRPWGMDKGPYPVLRPMLGYLLCLGFVPVMLGAHGVRRWAFAAMAVLSLGIGVQFWASRQWFDMDMVAEEHIYPDMPAFLPRPGWVGRGESPMVVDGHIARVHWTEYSFIAYGVQALPFVARREELLARLAWGLVADMEQPGDGPAAAAAVSRRSTARMVGWSTAIAASWAQLYYQVGALPVLVGLVGLCAAVPGWARVGRALLWLTRVGVWGVPLTNLFLLVVGFAGGLPEVTMAWGEATAVVLGLLAAVAAVDFAGSQLGRRAT